MELIVHFSFWEFFSRKELEVNKQFIEITEEILFLFFKNDQVTIWIFILYIWERNIEARLSLSLSAYKMVES